MSLNKGFSEQMEKLIVADIEFDRNKFREKCGGTRFCDG